jgi:hypothetical protein
MPKAFDSWNVFPHRPLEKLTENLWRVEGDIPNGDGTRVMTLARLKDGRLVIHNAIALEEPLMKEIESFGTPAAIVVPNGFHRLDAKVYKQRYPDAKIYCPKAAKKKVSQVVPVDGTYDDAPGDATVSLKHLDGTREGEGVLQVSSSDGITLTFNDAICNLAQVGGVMGFFLAPTGRASVSRMARWLVMKEKDPFRSHLSRLAETPSLRRIIVSHGSMITEAPSDVLKATASEL